MGQKFCPLLAYAKKKKKKRNEKTRIKVIHKSWHPRSTKSAKRVVTLLGCSAMLELYIEMLYYMSSLGVWQGGAAG